MPFFPLPKVYGLHCIFSLQGCLRYCLWRFFKWLALLPLTFWRPFLRDDIAHILSIYKGLLSPLFSWSSSDNSDHIIVLVHIRLLTHDLEPYTTTLNFLFLRLCIPLSKNGRATSVLIVLHQLKLCDHMLTPLTALFYNFFFPVDIDPFRLDPLPDGPPGKHCPGKLVRLLGQPHQWYMLPQNHECWYFHLHTFGTWHLWCWRQWPERVWRLLPLPWGSWRGMHVKNIFSWRYSLRHSWSRYSINIWHYGFYCLFIYCQSIRFGEWQTMFL